MFKNEAKPLGRVLTELLEVYKLKSKVTEVNLVNSWEQIAGPLIAKKTEKLLIKERKLHITVSSAPLKQELIYSKSQIVELVNKFMGTELIIDVVVH